MRKQDFYDDIIEDEFETVSLKERFEKYFIQWHWFLLSLIICLILAFVYLKLATPIYEAKSTVLVKDEKKGGMASELSVFADLGLGGSIRNNVDNEVEILKSRSLAESTIKKLNLNIGLFVSGKIVDSDIYSIAPIQISIVKKEDLLFKTRAIIDFKFLNSDSFELDIKQGDDEGQNLILSSKREFRFGEKIETVAGILTIDKNHLFDKNSIENFKNIRIVITPLDELAESFRRRIKIEPISKTSSVVDISITDPVAAKAEDFLNNMIQMYNRDAAEDKNFISENSSRFIAERLTLIAQELDGVEQDVESFKKSNKLTDIESDVKFFKEGSTEYDKKGVETEIQLNVVSSLLDFIKTSTESDLLPSNLVTDNSETSGLISNYNQLVLERNRILKSATVENPSVVKLDQQINSIRNNIVTSLNRLQSNLKIQNRDLKNQEGILTSKIGQIPSQERQFRVIARQQKVKEELYLYLLQKREETAISLAVTEPNARIIDVAKANKKPLSPNNRAVYLGAILLGLLIPFGFFYIEELLDDKIKDRNDIESKSQIPYIGDIPCTTDITKLIKSENRTSTGEAFRIVRTNLEFMLNKEEEKGAKTIFVTSTFASEGKTFISANLAATFALSEQKVLLIGMDIRSPKLNQYIDLPAAGLTNYLSSNKKELQEYIVKHPDYESFYILPSGVIPPNPAELLMSKKVNVLFEELKKEYDYIIVDTAPVNLVTDTLLIAKNANTFVYVMRAGVLEKKMINIANKLFKDKKLPNMCVVLNDTKLSHKYSYGYGEAAENKSWFKKK